MPESERLTVDHGTASTAAGRGVAVGADLSSICFVGGRMTTPEVMSSEQTLLAGRLASFRAIGHQMRASAGIFSPTQLMPCCPFAAQVSTTDASWGNTTALFAGQRKKTGATGLEPATSGVTGRRSNQLNYAPEGKTV